MMGRDRRNERRHDHFTQMIRVTMEEPAWRALSPVAQALYPWLRLEWHGEKANNNGRIRLSVRQAAVCLGITPNTAAKGFHDLQAKGFIVQTQHACLGTSGAATSPAYELTELALPYGDRRDGRKLYRDWRPGKEFPVHKASANNPEGRNGRIKPRLKNSDASVIEFETKRKVPSQK